MSFSPSRTAPTSVSHPTVSSGSDFGDDLAANRDALWQRVADELTINGGASTANSLVCTAGVQLLAYHVGNSFWLTPLATNTNAVVINVDGLGNRNLVGPDGNPLAAGDLPAGERVKISDDGTRYRLFRSQKLGAAAAVDPILHIAYQVSAGSNGGTATSGARQTYPLNTQLQNTISGAVFDAATNRINPLPIGTYDVDAMITMSLVNTCGIFLHNDTAAADVPNLARVFGFANSGTDQSTFPSISGRFTLAVASIIKLQYFVQTTSATLGLGNGGTDPGGQPCAFGVLKLRQVA